MRRVVRRSIRHKIAAMALGVSVLAVVLYGTMAVFDMWNMIRGAATTSQSLGETTAYDGRTALVGQAQDGLKEQARQKVKLTEERLLNITRQVETTAGYMNGVYQSPQRYLPRPVEKPAMRDAGKWALQYSLAGDVDYEAVQEGIDLAGSLCHIVAPLCEGNDTMSSIYFSSTNGFMISYDKNSDNMSRGRTASQPAELFVDHYDLRGRDWCQEAMETGRSVLTETYPDTSGRLSISCVVPVCNRGVKPVGVLAMDTLIRDINHSVVSARVGNRECVSLMNRDGYVVLAPDLAVIDETYEPVNLMEQEEIKTLAERMASGQGGLISLVKDGGDMFATSELIAPTGWSVAMVLPQEEVTAPAIASYENIPENTSRVNAQMEGTVHSAMVGVLALFTLILLGILFFAEIRLHRVTEPITRLMKEMVMIGQGNLGYMAEMHTGDELEVLGNVLNQMTKSLGECMENLAEATADRERIAMGLNVASTIQSSMLPYIFPASPDQKDFDIYADTHPAKAVNGDFYDFFKTGENHLWVMIVDVSGKGVPVALLTVTTRTTLKNYVGPGTSPAEVLAIVNDRLCENNGVDTLVTMFIGVFEMSSDIFTFSNAGHNCPLLYRKGGMFNWSKNSPNFVIADMEGTEPRDNRAAINPGNRLFLYTDSMTEILNRKEGLYEDGRLIETLNRPETREMSIDELAIYMEADLASYADGAEQADDITMLVLEIREGEE